MHSPDHTDLDALAEGWRAHVLALPLLSARRLEFDQQMEDVLEGLAQGEDGLEEFELLWDACSQEAAARPGLTSELETLLAGILGALNETIPDDVLEAFLNDLEQPLTGTQAVRDYLAEGDIGYLHLAVDQLLSFSTASAIAIPQDLA